MVGRIEISASAPTSIRRDPAKSSGPSHIETFEPQKTVETDSCWPGNIIKWVLKAGEHIWREFLWECD